MEQEIVTSWIKSRRGFIGVGAIIASAFLLVLVVIMSTVVLPIVTADARTTLERQGYVVLAAGEYSDIMTLLGSIDTKADAAVTNAEAAVVAAQTASAKVDLFNSAEVYLFPTTSNLTCTLTAGNTNVWSAWTEVIDSGANTLTTEFAAGAGYISDMLFFLPSDAADGYNVELAYGVAKTNLGRIGMWALADGDIAAILPIKSRKVPAGETVYYRMQSTGANGATLQARFRYFYE